MTINRKDNKNNKSTLLAEEQQQIAENALKSLRIISTISNSQ